MTDLPARLRTLTMARVALGRVGSAVPMRAALDFELAHARARDAVHAALPDDLAATLGAVAVHSRAADRAAYLQRPDLGRRVRPEDLDVLTRQAVDLAIVVADGLSALAVERHAAPLVAALRVRLADWTIAPIVLAYQARVAIGDEIAVAQGAGAVVVLIGERPGLSAPDSLGAYMSWAPRIGMPDSARNCVSNIRPPHGLGIDAAAARIAAILAAARGAGRTGVGLALPAARLPLAEPAASESPTEVPDP
jgi:ethanolamine ammonia-lyase small subunit